MTRKKIVDEYTDRRDLSRQRKYQLRHERDGLCAQCSRPQDPTSSNHCTVHLEARRRNTGSKPWVEGGRGTMPKKLRCK